MKRALAVLLAPLALEAACWGVSIDVGSTVAADADAVDAPSPPDVRDATDAAADPAPNPLGQCAVSGRIDRYFTAKELAARLIGRWAQCPGVMSSPLPCPPSARLWGIRFSADGTFALLGAPSEQADYVDQPETCGRGTFRFNAPAPADAGGADGGDAAPASEYVSFDDTTLRNGLEVHLFTEAGALDVELVEFEQGPERMFLREQGPLDSRGYFARLAPPTR